MEGNESYEARKEKRKDYNEPRERRRKNGMGQKKERKTMIWGKGMEKNGLYEAKEMKWNNGMRHG